MRKIAIVISGMSAGGAENSLINLLKEFTKGHFVRLYILQNIDNEINIPQYPNLEVFRLEADSLKDFKMFFKLKKELKLFDLVIAHLLWAQYWTGFVSLLDKSMRDKILWVEHNVYINRGYLEWVVLKFLGRFIKKIIAVSDEVGQSFSSKTNLKTEVIYNAISIHKDCYANIPTAHGNSFGIAFYGRVVTQKNPYLAINAYIQLAEEREFHIRTKLHVIGGGPLEAKLISDFSHLPNIEFLGYKEKNQALSELAKNQVYLSTSSYEGFPLARFEALKLGLCVVSTRTAGYNFLLNYYKSDSQMKKIGIYFVDNELNDIKNALKTLVSGNFWTTELISQRIECTDNLRPEIIAKKFLSI